MRARGKRHADLAVGDAAMPQPRAGDEVAQPAKQATPAEDMEAQPVARPSGRTQERPGADGFSLGRASPAADSGFGLDTARADVDRGFPVHAAASVAGADVSPGTHGETKEDVGSVLASKVRFMTQEAFEFFWNRGRHHFVRLGNQTVALKRAAAELKNRVVDEGGVIGLRPPSGIERYVENRRAGKHAVRGASLETAEIAKLRRDWEEAAASGDPDHMTRAANALIRAETARRARAGEPSPPAEGILNPSERSSVHTGVNSGLADRDAWRVPDEGSEFPRDGHMFYDPETAHTYPRSNSGVGPGEIAEASGVLPRADDDVGPGQIARDPTAQTAGSEHSTPTSGQTEIAVRAIMTASPERRASMSRRILESLSDEGAEELQDRSPKEIAAALSGGGDVLALSHPAGNTEQTDKLYRVQDRPGSRQKRFQPRDQTWEEWFWDWTPEGWGGPKDTFTSPPEDDRLPFDPRVGYYGRLQRRFAQARQRFGSTAGVDIDGERYQSLLMVGSNLDGKTAQGLSPEGVAFLVGILCDRTERFRTAEQAVDFLAKVERAAGKTMTSERREGLIRSLKTTRGAAARLLDNDLRPDDGFQTLVLIESAFDGLVPEGRAHAEATVMAHELGHVASGVLKVGEVFEDLPAYERDQVAKELENAFRSSRMSQGAVAGRGGDWERSPEEWFAEVFMAYLMGPESAKREAPLTCSVLRRLWNNHPLLGQILRLS